MKCRKLKALMARDGMMVFAHYLRGAVVPYLPLMAFLPPIRRGVDYTVPRFVYLKINAEEGLVGKQQVFMDNNELLNAASGYVAGNSIARGVAANLRKQREEMERRLAHIASAEELSAKVGQFLLQNDRNKAYEYLNAHLNEEIINAGQNQKDFIYSLETMLVRIKNKYKPFYERINMQIPDNITVLSADQLCEMLGVENLHIIDSTDGKSSPSFKADSGWSTENTICAIIIFIVIIILILTNA